MEYQNRISSELENENVQKLLATYNSSDPLAFYQELTMPFMMLIITCHPDDPENNILSLFTPDFQFNCSYTRTMEGRIENAMHQHNFFEFMYILKGTMYQIVEEKRYLYVPGSCCLLNRNTLHNEEYSSDFISIFFSVSADFVSRLTNYGNSLLFPQEQKMNDNLIFSFLKSNLDQEHTDTKEFLDFVPKITESQQKNIVHDIFEQMLHTLLNPNYGATYRLQDLFCQLIEVLSNPGYYTVNRVTAHSSMDSLLFARINQLLKKYDGRISNQELSSALNYNGTYLARVVKKHTGKSLFDYRNSFTMAAAEQMLSHTNKSVSEIASELRFTNRTHFYRLFEQYYGMTPRQYRAHTETTAKNTSD